MYEMKWSGIWKNRLLDLLSDFRLRWSHFETFFVRYAGQTTCGHQIERKKIIINRTNSNDSYPFDGIKSNENCNAREWKISICFWMQRLYGSKIASFVDHKIRLSESSPLHEWNIKKFASTWPHCQIDEQKWREQKAEENHCTLFTRANEEKKKKCEKTNSIESTAATTKMWCKIHMKSCFWHIYLRQYFSTFKSISFTYVASGDQIDFFLHLFYCIRSRWPVVAHETFN